MAIRVKRVYEPPAAGDGLRILVDRLWPRGLAKADVRLERWARELAPSDALRKWYRHDAAKWSEFKRRYREELASDPAALDALASQGARRRVTLLFGSKEPRLNNAYALKEILESRARRRAPKRRAQPPRGPRSRKIRRTKRTASP